MPDIVASTILVLFGVSVMGLVLIGIIAIPVYIWEAMNRSSARIQYAERRRLERLEKEQ